MAAKRRKHQKPTKAKKFNDDLILEIVKRLPLKRAARCSVLNTNIRRWISHPNFLPHSTVFRSFNHDRKIFKSINYSKSTTVHHHHHPLPLCRSVTLDANVSIIASCNGLLLLRFEKQHYVFNPTTSTSMLVGKCIGPRTAVGMAIPDNSPFKLVAVTIYRRSAGTHLKFRVIVPSLTGESMLLKSVVGFDCRQSFGLMRDQASRPVYAHGTLYWLGNGGGTTLAFDAEKEEARLIDGPVGTNELDGVFKWFGFADGAVQLVYASPSEIVIRRYDHRTDEWRLSRKIRNICNPSNNDYRNGKPLFFDGRRVLFLGWKKGKGGHVYRYDLLRHSWEEIERVDSWTDCEQNFFSYTPSFVKVSDTYLDKNNGSRNPFLGLQKLLRPPQN